MKKRSKPQKPRTGAAAAALAAPTVPAAGPIAPWPVDRLADHPENPRAVHTESPRFAELVASVRASGVLEPLTVREHRDPHEGLQGARDALGVRILEVLSGHRRLAAARVCGLAEVPVRNLGVLADDLAYDIVAMSNLHEDLTPLEEGRRAAVWLDHYRQDTAAVAAKLGRSERWVQRHAQIERGLTADWKAYAREDGRFARWGTAHWELIARLPRERQDRLRQRAAGNAFYGCADWRVDDLAHELVEDRLPLVSATFDRAGCSACPKRTGVQPLLWLEADDQDPAEFSGDKDRCLDARCWQKKTQAARRAQFTAAADQRGHPEAVPVSLIALPKRDKYGEDYYERQQYAEKLKPVRAVFKKTLVEADRVTVVPEGAKGAVPGIVVAGGKGRQQYGLVWVRVAEKPQETAGGRSGPSAAEQAQQAAQKAANARKEKVIRALYREIAASGPVGWQTALQCCLVLRIWPGPEPYEKAWAAWVREVLQPAGEKDFMVWLAPQLWAAVQGYAKKQAKDHYLHVPSAWPAVLALAPLFGLDAAGRLAELEAKDPQGAQESTKKSKAPGQVKGKKKRKTQAKTATGPADAPAPAARKCRVCGCTEDDCSACVERTGSPCTWVADDLCSACCACPVANGSGACLSDGNCAVCGRRVQPAPGKEAP